MIVIGVDPGFLRTGYGLIESKGWKLLDCGIWKVQRNMLPQGIQSVYQQAKETLRTYKPQILAIEEPFLSKNPRLALDIGKIVGSLTLAGLEENCQVETYSIPSIKEAVTGYGRANKEQVREMVKRILHIQELPSHLDISDALSVAICCVFNHQWREAIDRVS